MTRIESCMGDNFDKVGKLPEEARELYDNLYIVTELDEKALTTRIVGVRFGPDNSIMSDNDFMSMEELPLFIMGWMYGAGLGDYIKKKYEEEA